MPAPRTFLGKQAPASHQDRSLPRPPASAWSFYMLGPLVLAAFGAVAVLNQPLPAQPTPLAAVPTPTVRVLAGGPSTTTGSSGSSSASHGTGSGTTATGTSTGSTGTTTAAPPKCDLSTLAPGNPPHIDHIFPLIPAEANCPAGYWNLDLVRFFAYKALAIAQYLATVLAILLTVYAGLLYIAGFANEANVKKGKAILTAAYTGLVIVILAKFILYGTIQAVTGSNYKPGNLPDSSDILITPTPNTTGH